MISINMMSKADIVKGHGVLSAHDEQVELVKMASSHFEVTENKWKTHDITHFHTINLEYFFINLFAKANGVTVGSVHFLPETVENSIKLPGIAKKVFYHYLIQFYKNMDYLVTVNPYFIDVLESYGIPKEKVSYIPNVVSKERFFPFSKTEKEKARQYFGMKEDKFTVLCVGQLQTRKGVLDYIEIARQMPEMEFVWAGDFTFKKISEGYSVIKEAMKDIPPNLTFTGLIAREDMNALYNSADVMFLPSYEELLPMSLLEAMNCHIPILVRDLPEYEKVVSDFAVMEVSNAGFMKCLKMLQNNPDFYEKVTSRAKAGSEEYSAEHIAELWESFYKTVALHSRALKKKEVIHGEKRNI